MRDGGGKGGREREARRRDRREDGEERRKEGNGKTVNARMQAHVVILRGEHGVCKTCMSSFKAFSLLCSLPNESVIKPAWERREWVCWAFTCKHTRTACSMRPVTTCSFNCNQQDYNRHSLIRMVQAYCNVLNSTLYKLSTQKPTGAKLDMVAHVPV